MRLLGNPIHLRPWKRWLYIGIGALGLALVYLFHRYLNIYALLRAHPFTLLNYTADYQAVDPLAFSLNKGFRYLLNDIFAMILVYGLFYEKRFLRFSFYVLLFGLVVLMPTYLLLYLSQPEGFTSMISHLHRVVFNPVLMMLLIPAFFFQVQQERRSRPPGQK
jgi:exosortase F-associated protein